MIRDKIIIVEDDPGISKYLQAALRSHEYDTLLAPDGVIEALHRPASHFLWAVQWHPEFLYKVDPRSQAIFDAFVGSCR